MSRKKVTKGTKLKKTNTRKGTAKATGTSTTISTLEKNFKATPSKIIAQYRKELTGMKGQEKKLQLALKKAQTQKQTATKQISTITAKHKTKPTATGKKQLTKHNKNLGTTNKTITDLTKQLAQLKQTTTGLSHGISKHTAINKQLSALDKEWRAKALTTKTAKTATPAKAKKTKTRTTTTKKPETTSTSSYDSTSLGYTDNITDKETETSE